MSQFSNVLNGIIVLLLIVQFLKWREFVENEEKVVMEKLQARDIRVLALGDSWKHCNRTLAYPSLIGGNQTMFITERAPHLPLICLEELLGDKIFDVVFVEYTADYKVTKLLGKLRRRFPRARIFIVKFWDVKQYFIGKRNFVQFSQNHGFHDLGQPELYQFVFTNTIPEHWKFSPQDTDWLNSAAEDENVFLWEFPRHEDPRVALAHALTYFQNHEHHPLTPEGHARVAYHLGKEILFNSERKRNRLMGFALQEKEERNEKTMNQPHSWTFDGDACTLFPQLTTEDDEDGYPQISSMEIGQEFVAFHVENPLPIVQGLFLAYRVDVSTTLEYSFGDSTRIFTPNFKFASNDWPTKVSRMGLVPTGNMTLWLRATEGTFHLTGILVSNHIEHPVEFN